MKRYDLIIKGSHYYTSNEMESSVDGKWIRYEDVEPFMSLFSGTRLTERNVENTIHERVKAIVLRLVENQIDHADAIRQLEDLLIRAVNAKTRHMKAEKESE